MNIAKLPIIRLASLTVASLLLPSCSDEASQLAVWTPTAPATSDPDADAGKFVPADALAVARINNIGAFTESCQAIAKAIQPGFDKFVDVALLLGPSGLRPKDLDMSGSPMVALAMGKMGPAPVFIVPARDADDASDVTPMPSTVAGKILALGTTGKPVAGDATPAIAKGLNSNGVVIRVDLKKTLAVFRSQIDAFLSTEMLTGMEPSISMVPGATEMVDAAVTAANSLLDSAEQFEMAINVEDGAVDLNFTLNITGGADIIPSGKAMTLAQLLPADDAAMYAILDGDWSKMGDLMKPMLDAAVMTMPGADKGKFSDLMTQAFSMYESMDSGLAFAMDFGNEGIRGVGIVGSNEPDKFITDYIEFLKNYNSFFADQMEKLGGERMDIMKLDKPHKSSVGDLEIQTVSIDMANVMKLSAATQGGLPGAAEQATAAIDAILGKDGLKFGMAATKNQTLIAFGDIDAQIAGLATSLEKGTKNKSAFLEYAAKRLHAQPIYFFGGDLRRMAKQITTLMGKIQPGMAPPIPDGDPIYWWISLSSSKKGYGLQIHANVKAIAELVRGLIPR